MTGNNGVRTVWVNMNQATPIAPPMTSPADIWFMSWYLR